MDVLKVEVEARRTPLQRIPIGLCTRETDSQWSLTVTPLRHRAELPVYLSGLEYMLPLPATTSEYDHARMRLPEPP